MKKSSSGGSRLVPRRQRNVRKSSVLGLSPPALAPAACCGVAIQQTLDITQKIAQKLPQKDSCMSILPAQKFDQKITPKIALKSNMSVELCPWSLEADDDVGPEAVEEELECDCCCCSRAACACARLLPLLEATTDLGTSVTAAPDAADLAGLLVAEPWPWANLR